MSDPSFERVCRHGYQILGQHNPDTTDLADNPWFCHSGYPPSYAASGRMRLLDTLHLAQSLAPRSIFEVAAGDGLLAACLFRDGTRIVVNDLRPLPLARWKNGDRIESVSGNFFEIDPEKIGSFDLVIACEVIEHVAHGDKFAKHLMRFVKPGGHLLITTPNGAHAQSRLPTYSQVTDFAALEALQFKPDADGHLYLYTEEEIRAVFEGAGADRIEVRYSGSPFISGAFALRLLPRSPRLFALYEAAEKWTRRLGSRRRLCNQLMVVAHKPGA